MVAGCVGRVLFSSTRLSIWPGGWREPGGRLVSTSGLDFLRAGEEMGERMRALDWSATPLGPVDTWPQSLRAALSICLGSRFPIALYWGSHLTLLYNRAWSSILGAKHPWALGRDAREVWPEIWDTIGPLFQQVMTRGESTYSEDQLLAMHRHGYTEECYFNYTFTPVHGEDGSVQGVFNAVIETTYRVIGERRTEVLRALGEALTAVPSAQQACDRAVEVLRGATADAPFAAVYLLEPDGQTALLAGSVGLPPGSPAATARVVLGSDEDRALWSFERPGASRATTVVDVTAQTFGQPPPGGPWPEAATSAFVTPLLGGGAGSVRLGFVVLGVSPRRAVDEAYRQFAERVAVYLTSALVTARAYEEEKKRAEALAEIDRAKTAFFSNVSHEFRTPLTLMLSPLDDLRRAADAGQPVDREQLALVQRNSQRLLKLVNTLLDFSRLEAGRAQAHYEPTDLGALTADLASTFRAAIERGGVRLEVDCPPLAEPVFVDHDMWEKIVLNLLSNAFKHTFDGVITVRLRDRGPDVVLEVSDTGIGIPEGELPNLFERFHRVHGARSRTHEGTGIGLALVHELTRLHRGHIDVT
ncbi:MAG: two-component system sensor histidine kinase/response regulator, partial [Myxococcales bacterium]